MEGDNSHVGGCDSFSPTPMSSPVEYPNSSPVDSPSARNEAETQETQGTSQTVEGELEPKVGDKRLRSTVWEHFTKIQVNGLNKAECKYCKKLLGGESKNGTKHLHDHHKICRMRPYQPLRQQTLTFNKDNDGNVIVDNCSTNDALINNMLSKLNRKHLLFGGKFFHMRCCAHILNLIVQDGLKVMGNGLERVRDSVTFWLASPKRQQLFKESATHLGIEYSKQLVQDCKTRWNSTYLMLSVALQYKDVFDRLEQQESSFLCAPFEQDWELAENICEKLEVFYKASNVFSGRKYPTSNVFFLLMSEIKVNLREWVESTDLVIGNMAKSMLAKFDKYWEVVHGILAVANVLDPRYKLGVVQYFFQTFYGDKAASEIEKVKTYCNDLCRDYECSSIATSSSKHVQSVVGGANLTKGDPVRNKLKTFMESATHLAETSELDLYLEAKRSPFDDDLDVLSWWQTEGKKYPTLSKIAKDLLAIPVSTVASESAFSTGGRLLSAHRSRLHPDILEALMCSQSWSLESSEDYEIDEDLLLPQQLEA